MRRASILLVSALCAGCTSPSSQPLDEAAFTRAYVERLAQADTELDIEVQAPLRVVATKGGGSYASFLDNAYRQYLDAPDALPELLEAHVAAGLEAIAASADSEVDRERVVPVIKDVAFLAEAARTALNQLGPGVLSLHHEPLNAQLMVLYALDSEHSFRFLSADEVAALGLDREELRALAVGNLRRLLPAIEVSEDSGRFLLVAGGTYEASLLLFDELWTHDQFPVAGDLVVAVPSRDVLVVTGSDDEDGLRWMRAIAREVTEQAGHALTEDLFVRRDGRWALFAP